MARSSPFVLCCSLLIRYWQSRGFVSLVQLKQSTLQIRQGNGLVLPDLEVSPVLSLEL